MTDLKKNIFQKVYIFETKRTAFELVLRIGSVIAALIAGALVFMSIIQKLLEQQTLDVFELFREETEIIRNNINEVLNTLYLEFPKYEVVVFATLTIISIVLVLIFIKNYKKIKNRVLWLQKYKQSH